MEITFGFLALKPRTALEGGRLTIDSPWLVRFGSLGMYRRTVVVDPDRQCFDFTTRRLGKTTRRTVAFSEVSRLDYSFDETGFHTDSPWVGSQDSTEWFTISIVLESGREELRLGRFIGEGSVDHGWKGIVAGDDAFDYRGDQQERSLGLVKLLQAMTGLPLT
jgi:hypothetical protein